jgi:hypothetical protein
MEGRKISTSGETLRARCKNDFKFCLMPSLWYTPMMTSLCLLLTLVWLPYGVPSSSLTVDDDDVGATLQ